MRGNLVFTYAVKTGQAAMIEAVLAQFPPDEVGGMRQYEVDIYDAKRQVNQSAHCSNYVVFRRCNCVFKICQKCAASSYSRRLQAWAADSRSLKGVAWAG